MSTLKVSALLSLENIKTGRYEQGSERASVESQPNVPTQVLVKEALSTGNDGEPTVDFWRNLMRIWYIVA